MATALTLPNGKEYQFAEATFSKQTVRLIVLFDEAARANTSGNPASFENAGELITLLHAVMTSCLTRAGHTEDEAEEAVSSIPFGPAGSDAMNSIRVAVGLQ